MEHIIETLEQFEYLERYFSEKVFIEPVQGNDKYHPMLTDLVGVYLKVHRGQEYFIPIEHSEGLNVPKNYVILFINKFKDLYCVDKKRALHLLGPIKVKDLKIVKALVEGEDVEGKTYNKALPIQSRDLIKDPDINKITPIGLLMDSINREFIKYYSYITEIPEEGFKYLNNKITPLFYLLERNPIHINTEKFIEYYSIEDLNLNIKDNKVYTRYNIYNKTTRPTNSFNQVNFLAIPKTLQARSLYKPQNDYFFEYDYDGYHLRLIGNEVGYKFTDESAHKQLAQHILKKENISEEEYSEIKQTNFQAIYGNIKKEYRDMEFYKLLRGYIESTWEEFNKKGFIENKTTKVRIKKGKEQFTETKLFNYMVQSIETSNNVEVLLQLLNTFKGKQSKIVLYTYDSIIIDACIEDGKDFFNQVVEIMEQGNKFKINRKVSKNLLF